MKMTLTMTSKGQFTLPAEVRKDLGLKQNGDKLVLHYDKAAKRGSFWKLQTIEELSAYLTAKIKPGTPPITNVDEYYQANRGKYIR